MKKKVLIIGGGTAGVVLASRLAQYADVTVLERSTYTNYPLLYKVPLLGGLLFQQGKYVKQRVLHTQQRGEIPFFESNVVGGASMINGCVHALGSLERWKEVFSGAFFDSDELMSAYHQRYALNGKSGALSLLKAPQGSLSRLFLDALDRLGIEQGDMDRSDSPRRGPVWINAGRWFRSSIGWSFPGIGSARIRKGSKVDYLTFDAQGKCTGCSVNEEQISADLVILAAGVIGTSCLLNRTRKRQMDRGGMLARFGQGIKDHPNVRIKVVAKPGYQTLNEISRSFWLKAVTFVKHWAGIPTLFRTPGATSAAYLDLDKDGVVDTKVQLVHFTEQGRLGSDDPKQLFDSRPGFSLAITLLNPKSSGEVDEQGNINPGYFTCDEDTVFMKRALAFGVELLQSEPLSQSVEEIVDQQLIEHDPEQYLMKNFFSGYHLIGGAAFGGEESLLTSELAVKGVKGLYVCDASVFREHVSSNTHAPVVLLADLFSQHLIHKEL